MRFGQRRFRKKYIQKTLENFLATYTPTIVDKTFTITTTCGSNCEAETFSLKISLTGAYEIVPTPGGYFSAFYKAYPSVTIKDKSFIEIASKNNYVGAGTTTTNASQQVNISIYNTSVSGLLEKGGVEPKEISVELADQSINNDSWGSYSVPAFASGFNVSSGQNPQTGIFSLPDNLEFTVYDGTTAKTFTTNQIKAILTITSPPVNGKGSLIVQLEIPGVFV